MEYLNQPQSSSGNNYDDIYQQKRWEMVEDQIISRGVSNPNVIDAMLKVKRHLFAPDKYLDSAYDDRPIPIEHGQTVSQPYMVALMTELLDPSLGKKILEIGTGSGYQTAVLAEIGCQVFTVEIIEEITARSRKILDSMGFDNITYKIGDGYQGWEKHAPYEAIIVTAAPTEIPEKLLDQLASPGRMVIPVGQASQDLFLIKKSVQGIEKKRITAVRFVPMTHSKN